MYFFFLSVCLRTRGPGPHSHIKHSWLRMAFLVFSSHCLSEINTADCPHKINHTVAYPSVCINIGTKNTKHFSRVMKNRCLGHAVVMEECGQVMLACMREMKGVRPGQRLKDSVEEITSPVGDERDKTRAKIEGLCRRIRTGDERDKTLERHCGRVTTGDERDKTRTKTEGQ